jgi:DNA-binding SARP family transcriptional activator
VKIQHRPARARAARQRLADVYPRAQLFDALDHARARPLTWIAAPAGAGKTTLVASYLAARKLASVWYSFDVRDGDAATFFFYLREALRAHAPREHESLPLLRPEYSLDLPVFTRNFFDAAYARLRSPAALVFDNYQDLPADSVLQRLLPEVLRAAPEGVSVIVLSREAAPPAYAQLHMTQAMSTLGATNLQLSLTEAQGIAHLHGVTTLESALLEALHAKVQGWAAGWVLLLEHLRANAQMTDLAGGLRDTLFDYFASEFFERAAPDVQTLLLKTACLPQVAVASAAALSGLPNAAATLADLERRNYLTTPIAAREPTYQFHPLFREFLVQRARRTYSESEWRACQQQAAQLLCQLGAHDEAVPLLIESQAWDALSRLIQEQAHDLAAQGRLATLESWLRALPAQTIDREPWLLLWLALSRLPFDMGEARAHFAQAFRAFKQRGDARGMYRAWTGIGQAYFYLWDDYSEIDPWLDELSALLRANPLDQFADVAPRVASAALLVLSIARPERAEVHEWVSRMEHMAATAANLRHVAPVLFALAAHYVFTGATDKARRLQRDLETLAGGPDADPLRRASACSALITITRRAGDLAAARHWADTALALCERLGMRTPAAFLYAQACNNCKIADDVEGLATYLQRAQSARLPRPRMEVLHYEYHAAWLAWRRGEWALAREYAQKALEIDEGLTAHLPAALSRVMLATVLVECRDFAAANEHLAALADYVRHTGNGMLGFTSDLVLAWSQLRQGQESACAATLARALAYGRAQHDNLIFADWFPRVVTPLLVFALERNIEPEYARTLIRRRHLVPEQPPLHLDNWPWPVKLYTLGRFGVLRNDAPLRFEGKAQKKPLELLKALVALGGRDVREDRLTEALWPDAEADAAVNALTTAVYRLRKLLGEDVIVRGEGKLSLDARCCWADVWALERALSGLQQACRDGQPEAVWENAERLLDLYRGEFLRSEAEAPWLLSARERLRSKLLRQLEAAGVSLAQAGRHAEAALCYHKALEVEPLADSLYRGLIALHLEQQRHPEALLVYRRCRKMLATHLGLAPSAETEALARRIGGVD